MSILESIANGAERLDRRVRMSQAEKARKQETKLVDDMRAAADTRARCADALQGAQQEMLAVTSEKAAVAGYKAMQTARAALVAADAELAEARRQYNSTRPGATASHVLDGPRPLNGTTFGSFNKL